MINDNTSTIRDLSAGDRAVSGLLRGLAGGLVMGLVLVLAGLLSGDSLAQAADRFNLFSQSSILQGLLLHMGVAGVYGIIFGLLQIAVPRRVPGWLVGLLYGLLLFGLAEWVILPGTASNLASLPGLALLLAHLLYGLVLGI